jgi:methylthioxylose transferase
VWAGAGLTVLLVLTIGLRFFPFGARDGHFAYSYFRAFAWQLIWPFAVALAVALGLLWLSHRMHARFEWPTVLAWLAAAVPLQLTLRWYAETPLGAIVHSDRANGFYSPTQRWSASEFISRYMDIVGGLHAHARTNMPGKTMLYYLLGSFTEAPVALGVLVMVVANVGALMAYLIVRDWLCDRRAALYALVLYLVVPGMIFFLPILNAVSPVPILLALWLHIRFVQRGHWVYAALLGPALYLTLFFEPLPMVMGLVFVAILAVALRRRSLTWLGAGRLIAVMLAAFAATHLVMRLTVGYDIFANVAYVVADAQGFNEGWRPYELWLTRNLSDFAAATGLATLALVMAAAWGSIRGTVTRPVAALTLSGLTVLVVLDLAGINRGETLRLWIFLAVFLQIAAAWLCARTSRLWPFAVVLAATMLQASAGVSMIGFVRP